MALNIENVWLFISSDETGEGIIGMTMGNTFMPLIAADAARLESLRPHARGIAQHTGKTVKLIKFTTREEIETITP